MSTLHDRLSRIKENFLKQAPPEAVAVMTRATNDLRDSGIMTGIPQPGSQLPDFSLEDTDGKLVGSGELLAQGSLVISFYRGVW